MPGFFDALKDFKPTPPKKHYVTIDGNKIEVPLQKHIEIIKPSILVLLGGTATKAILATTLGITKLRGKWHEYKSLNIKEPISTMAMYHPAFLLRSPGHKKEAWEDLQKIQKKITSIRNEDI